MMNLNFAPKREEMDREIEHCVELNRLDTLNSLCNSCLNQRVDTAMLSSCTTCTIQVGKETILKRVH